MNAPLSRYLTQFSAAPVAHAVDLPPLFEPRISLSAAELDARLEAAAAAARAEVELRLTSEAEKRQAEKDNAVTQALADARATWTESQADVLATHMSGAMTELRQSLADALVRVLRPVLSDSLRTRTVNELKEVLDKLLADPGCRALSVRGPADLIGLLRQRCGNKAIEWIDADDCEVTILAGATRIDTCLAAALAELAQPGV